MKKLYLIAPFLISGPVSVFAQDPFFSQTYSAPMHLNPALAGSTGAGRFSGVVKLTGTNLDNSYKAYHYGYDQLLNKIHSGMGIYYTGESMFDDTQFSHRFGLNYAVLLNLIKKKNLRLTPAVELAYQRMEYDWIDNLTLSNGFTPANVSEWNKNVNVFDLGAGLLLNSRRLNFGVVVKHITRPDLSFGSGPMYLRTRTRGNVDYVFGKIEERRAWKLAPGVRYSTTGGANVHDVQLSLAALYHKFKFGIAYRGTTDRYDNSVSAQISYNGWLFKFRYTYDFFTGVYIGDRPQGHEATMLFNLFGKKKKDDFVESPNYAF